MEILEQPNAPAWYVSHNTSTDCSQVFKVGNLIFDPTICFILGGYNFTENKDNISHHVNNNSANKVSHPRNWQAGMTTYRQISQWNKNQIWASSKAGTSLE